MGRLAVVTDANDDIGIGHAMRSLAIAQVYVRNGWQVCLETASMHQAVRKLYEDLEIPVQMRHSANNAEELVERLIATDTDMALVDGYHLDRDFRHSVTETNSKILTIDDHGDPVNFIADIVVNPWHYCDRINLPTSDDVLLLAGPEYFPFRESVLRAANTEALSLQNRRNWLLTLGGSDPICLTEEFLKAAANSLPHDVRLDVVVGPANPRAEMISNLADTMAGDVQLHMAPDYLPKLMRDAGLAISAGGGTSAELARLGTPLIMVLTVENQMINGANAWCPVADGRAVSAAELLFQTTLRLWQDEPARNAIAQAGRKYYHSDGAQLIFERATSV